MAESGGDVGLVRVLLGVETDLVRALVGALESVGAACVTFEEQLGAAGVHEHAFGKLIDAAKVRDAYHDRLPATKVNLTEAREVAESFIAEFTAKE
ncbi:hypothetical protein KDK95_01255 [Actinospica sp. MGRD01-02]|uniref:Uncharacterized protein n=1 Tax=Actinospica acidithermotolerans TaxID=2828514 RepID=A0A941E6N7_9ACTN|nr:hypothetical protein [Actinospica acidithermotolerans]MBR7824918.1 hypothetical protein [Actinospica acidithermotolerans]